MDANNAWWKLVPGPQKMIDDVSSAVLGSQTIWLPATLPFPMTFFSEMTRRVREIAGYTVVLVDARYNDDPKSVLIPKQDLMYCSPAADYKSFIRGRYGAECKLYLIYNLNSAQPHYNEWLELCKFFAVATNRPPACKLQIACHGIPPSVMPRGTKKLGVENYCTVFGVLFFAMYVLSQSEKGASLPNDFRMYLTHLLAEAYRNDVEKLADCIPTLVNPHNDPLTVLTKHGLTGERAEHVVKIAQTKVLLPKIEEQRHVLIQELSLGLECLLQGRYTDDYGNVITKIREFELRHLKHFADRGALRLSGDQADRLDVLHDARNLIAHLHMVSPTAALKILSMPSAD